MVSSIGIRLLITILSDPASHEAPRRHRGLISGLTKTGGNQQNRQALWMGWNDDSAKPIDFGFCQNLFGTEIPVYVMSRWGNPGLSWVK